MAEGGTSDLEIQKKDIDSLLKVSLKKGDTWYLIDTKWFKQWKKYVGYDTWDSGSVEVASANPGPIDNKNLFKENIKGLTPKLKECMIDDIDYMLLPEEAWNKLVGWYGLTEGQVIVIELRNKDGTWPRQANSTSSYNNSGPLRSDIQSSSISEEQPLSCITEQLPEELTHAQQMETLSEILTKLETRVVTSHKNIVNVHRDNVLDGGFRAFGRKSFDAWCELHVRFSGEDGIDAGGPQREFMCLALRAIKELPIFSGPDNAKILVYDYKCLTECTYYKAGQMLAYFIVHRGPCPNFISPTLYSALAEGIASMQPTSDEILDYELHEQVETIAAASNEEDFKAAVLKAVELINRARCTSLTLQFTPERQTTLVKSLTKFVVCDRILGPFEQFENGLQAMGLVDEIKKNKQQWKEVFIFSTKPLHALQMDSLFAVKWSAEGSNKKCTEERILVYWRDFLQDLEEGEGEMSLTLKELLAFTTGADEVPPLGFPFPPQLSFTHPEDLSEEAQLCSAGFPYANTSSMELKIPVLNDYNTFQSNMAAAISMTATFINQSILK